MFLTSAVTCKQHVLLDRVAKKFKTQVNLIFSTCHAIYQEGMLGFKVLATLKKLKFTR